MEKGHWSHKMEQTGKTFFQMLPKVELHAHLNGSLSKKTIKELYEMTSEKTSNPVPWKNCELAMNMNEHDSLEECFQLFAVAHSVTSSPKAVYKATHDVIQEFADDGVVYLELRSTPREMPGIMTKSEYIEAIIDAIKSSSNRIVVKLLVSLDRRHGRKIAEETLTLTLNSRKCHPDIVVGLDLSGDPNLGDIVSDYLPVLDEARHLGLKITVHCAEVPQEMEVIKILQLKPHRLGHGTCIHPSNGGSEKLWKLFLESQIPVELCLTSNVKCKTVKSYADHHFKHVFSSKHPLTLATDDKGVFSTCLSEEYQLAAQNFNLSEDVLWQISFDSINYTFSSEQEKQNLRERFLQWRETHLEKHLIGTHSFPK